MKRKASEGTRREVGRKEGKWGMNGLEEGLEREIKRETEREPSRAVKTPLPRYLH